MEESSKKDDTMDIDRPEDVSAHSTLMGSPSCSSLEREECTEEEEEVNTDHGEPEEEKDTEEEKAARRKAKGKAYAPPEEDDDDEHTSIAKLTSSPTVAENTETDVNVDMDTYWAPETRKAHEIAARQDSLRNAHALQFGDADAAMNDALSSSSFTSPDDNNEHNQNNNANPAAPNNSPSNCQAAPLDYAKLLRELARLQQRQQPQQDDGRCRGRGVGREGGSRDGWGLAWQETMTREKVEKEGWGACDDSLPSSSEQKVQQDMGWEVYDEAAWASAAEKAARLEAGKVTLKVPRSSFSSVKRNCAREEGRLRGSIDRETGGKGEAVKLTGQKGELVRAVRGYKPILPGTYLNYEKGDVMTVLHRDGDGRWIYCE